MEAHLILFGGAFLKTRVQQFHTFCKSLQVSHRTVELSLYIHSDSPADVPLCGNSSVLRLPYSCPFKDQPYFCKIFHEANVIHKLSKAGNHRNIVLVEQDMIFWQSIADVFSKSFDVAFTFQRNPSMKKPCINTGVVFLKHVDDRINNFWKQYIKSLYQYCGRYKHCTLGRNQEVLCAQVGGYLSSWRMRNVMNLTILSLPRAVYNGPELGETKGFCLPMRNQRVSHFTGKHKSLMTQDSCRNNVAQML
jgi:hypothetical protein